ncbi:hypothetical protein TELCIR_17448 [Teladorsagia circumcincta]|uniref:Uncharacterized protein n=1 Tax=Teladorsagia circumcincta TaxID=45464 RepID=A0A2G9TUA1_TELCI|nr:hypothetical protein TELCIR_17448 [Teladorsagia circumcincta]
MLTYFVCLSLILGSVIQNEAKASLYDFLAGERPDGCRDWSTTCKQGAQKFLCDGVILILRLLLRILYQIGC